MAGHLLPYRVFSKDQRVSHTSIVENKRLGHALVKVKAQQALSTKRQWDQQRQMLIQKTASSDL